MIRISRPPPRPLADAATDGDLQTSGGGGRLDNTCNNYEIARPPGPPARLLGPLPDAGAVVRYVQATKEQDMMYNGGMYGKVTSFVRWFPMTSKKNLYIIGRPSC